MILFASVGVSVEQPSLDRVVFIHYKQDFAKPPWANGGKGGNENSYKGYDFLAKGAKWKQFPIDVYIDPQGSGLDQVFVLNTIVASTHEWDSHTGTTLFGLHTLIYDGSWDNEVRDGRNELVFGNYPDPQVIAVAVVWGIFYGPPQNREIVEFDILFDVDFSWGDATVDSSVMDLQNIATHELGHGLGLADLYEDKYSEETMYGYSMFGEIKKRDLYKGDIAGIQELYGA